MHKMSFIFLSLLIFFLTKVISKTLALKEKKKKVSLEHTSFKEWK